MGSRVNIQQKLQEKKQKQLAELRVIEEEIKQGKLAKTTSVAVEEIYSSLQRQPIPRAKTHADPSAWPRETHSYQNYPLPPHTCNPYPAYTEVKTYDFQTPDGADKRNLYNGDRTLYENPNHVLEANRTIRSNYLETRAYNGNVLDIPVTPLIPPYEQSEYYTENNNEYNNTVESIRGVGYPALPGNSKLEQLRLMQRCRTPEILLAPHYLEGCGRPVCCQWGGPATYNA